MFKTSQTLIVGMALILVSVGCGEISKTTISEIEYKQVLGKAVCEAVTDLNSRGVLDDAAAIENEFDGLIQNSVEKMGYDSADWLTAKAEYFPDEAEHTKLVKMHFTWCLVGDSISE